MTTEEVLNSIMNAYGSYGPGHFVALDLGGDTPAGDPHYALISADYGVFIVTVKLGKVVTE